jgi:hypothetical protein
MHRRELLKLLTAGAAIPALSPNLRAFFREAQAQVGSAYKLRTLNPRQDATLTTMVDLIIPATETPGAKAARVNEFIDVILTEWATDQERAHFFDGLADVDHRSRALFAKDFVDCAQPQQEAILTALDEGLAVERQAVHPNFPSVRAPDPGLMISFFGVVKQLTLHGYYTSEIGFLQERKEEIIPGSYHGCVPLPAESKS